MKETQAIQEILAERLRIIDPKMVVLFGSHAHGTPSQDSDFDVYVVTKDQFIPRNYQEKRQLDILTDLDDLYINARCSGDFGLLPHGKPSREEAREFMMFAQEAFETISRHVGVKSSPDTRNHDATPLIKS